MNRFLVFILFMVVETAYAATALPHTFQAGQPARASEVNQNMTFLHNGVRGSVGTLIIREASAQSAIDTSVVSVNCPVNAQVVGAGCFCTNASGTRNFGVLYACVIAGNAGIVGCHSEALTFDSLLPPPRGEVTVRCLEARNNDGNPLTISVFSALGGTMQPAATTGSDDPATTKTLDDELNERLNLIQQQIADHEALIRQK